MVIFHSKMLVYQRARFFETRIFAVHDFDGEGFFSVCLPDISFGREPKEGLINQRKVCMNAPLNSTPIYCIPTHYCFG